MNDLGIQPHIIHGAVRELVAWAGMLLLWALLLLAVWRMVRGRG